jgi:peptidoglycan DL-endopeptidase LytF
MLHSARTELAEKVVVASSRSRSLTASTRSCTYTIKSGDTYNKIAAALGTTAAALEALNPGSPANSLQIGHYLTLCSCSYTINSGDTYNSIAAVYGTTAAALEALNPTQPANNLQIGNALTLCA